MTLTIEHYPSQWFRIFNCSSPFNIDINQSIQSKLKPGEELTNDTALKILKQIKLKSDFLAFITKPVFLIPFALTLAVGVTVCNLLIPAVGVTLLATIALVTAKVLLLAVGGLAGFLLGWSVSYCIQGGLSELSKAYSEQGRKANDYIEFIKRNNVINFLI